MSTATISADIISYTSLSDSAKRKLEESLQHFHALLSRKFKDAGYFGRLVQGDSIECAMLDARYSLRIALLFKTLVKSFKIDNENKSKNNIKYFEEHGIRIAIAVAPLSRLDPKSGIIDGEAIYLSGRTIKGLSTSDKQKIIIKNTMFFRSTNKKIEELFDVQISLIDSLISRCSVKQSEVLKLKLLGYSEKEISKLLQRSQSTISQHSNAAGWNSLEKALNYYENQIK